jgi:hypothetical protein
MSLPSKLDEFVVVCRVDGLARKERKRRVRPKGLSYTESSPNVLNERTAPDFSLNQGRGMLKRLTLMLRGTEGERGNVQAAAYAIGKR